MKCRRDTIKRMRIALANFSMEYLDDLQKAEKEREICEKAKESDTQVCIVLTGKQNAEVMLECMKDMKKAIEFMTNADNDVENWQLAGINAMFDQCNAEHIIPFDIGTAVCGILGTEFYK
jgi:uncharacterized UPF0160 family protein